MIRVVLMALPLFLLSVAIRAQQAVRPDGAGGYVIEDQSGCNALWGAAAGQCLANQQKLERQKQQAQQQEQVQERQLQQKIQEQQLENARLKNEFLRNKLAQEHAATEQGSQQQNSRADVSKNPEFQNWIAANPWFESDRAKREFAMLYAKQLKQERPGLTGRPFLDALSAKVNEVFGSAK